MQTKTLTYCAAVFISTFIVYFLVLQPVLSSVAYVIDDEEILAALPGGGLTLTNLKKVAVADKSIYLPLTGLTHLIEMSFAQGNSERLLWLMRVGNIFLLSLAAVWFFLLVPKRQLEPWIVSLGALVFALHPLHTIPTAWIASRKDVLVCCLMLLTVLLRQKRWHGAAVLVFILALLSKLSAYALVYWVVVDEALRLKNKESSLKNSFWAVSSYMIPVLILMPFLVNRGKNWVRMVYVVDQSFSLMIFYIAKVLWPWPVMQYYPPPMGIGLFWGLLLLVILISLPFILLLVADRLLFSRWIIGTFALVFAMILPYVVVLPNHLLVNNAYAYSLVAPIVLLILHGIIRVTRTSWVRNTWIFILIAMLAFFSFYNRTLAVEFANPVAAFERDVELSPNNFSAYQRLAKIAEAKGESDKALKVYQKAIEIHVERRKRIPIEAFEGMLGVALRSRRADSLQYLGQLAAKNNQPYYCLEVQRGLSEFSLQTSDAILLCQKRFPLEMAEKKDSRK